MDLEQKTDMRHEEQSEIHHVEKTETPYGEQTQTPHGEQTQMLHEEQANTPREEQTWTPYGERSDIHHEEKENIKTTAERQYDNTRTAFVKRSLAPHEFIKTQRGNVHIPFHNKERLQNEADCLRFIRQNTNIPVPEVLGFYESEGAWYLCTSLASGTELSKPSREDGDIVRLNLRRHRATLRSLKSRVPGGPKGILSPPSWLTDGYDEDGSAKCDESASWQASSPSASNELFRFCHCDLSATNIFVDPVFLEITAIIDWEYSGFFPEVHEVPYYRRGDGSGYQGKYFTEEMKQIKKFGDARRER
ncbi:hypothetical protein LZ554_004830 [Drepanopeziza brunnea f. sp. 'monogermtubi']|nr:hypothetical protein LZ554_004830 [Drepanopeziza brunnea f. sp. 'monogermtubi']